MSIPAIQYADATKRFHKPGTHRLTPYEFRCGYVQQTESPFCTFEHGIQLRMWMEHGVYHVRAHDFTEHRRIFWDSFDSLNKANSRYYSAIRELNL